MSSSVSDQAMSLYKFAAPALCKKSDAKSDLAMAIAGTVLGGGAGYVADKLTPEDEDEDKKSRLLTNILTGAALGGVGGFGMSRLGRRLGMLVDKPGFFQRNVPEFGWSTAAGLTAAGTGTAAGRSLYYQIQKKVLENRDAAIRSSVPNVFKLEDSNYLRDLHPTRNMSQADVDRIRETAAQWDKAKSGILNDIKMLFSKKARRAQIGKDRAFRRYIRGLRPAGGTGITGGNPRKYMDAIRKGRNARKIALLAAISLGSGLGSAALNGAD